VPGRTIGSGGKIPPIPGVGGFTPPRITPPQGWDFPTPRWGVIRALIMTVALDI